MLAIISLLSFLLPTQLGLHVNSLQSTSGAGQAMLTVYGFRIDYLIPTLYLTDIIAIIIIFLGIRRLKITKSHMLYAICFMVFAGLNIYISDYFISNLYRWLKVTEMILLGIVIFNTKKFDVFKHFVKPLSFSVFVTCVLGVWQFLIKGSIGGIFYWFGERNFVFSDPNIAPYPYSIFSHPNSFAGFLLVFAIFLLQHKNKFYRLGRPSFAYIKYFWLLTILVAINLVLTNSLNVYITTAILLVLKFRPNLSLAYFAFDYSERFISHRIELIKAALTIVKENFWFGVGLNNFIPSLVKVSNTFVNSWELQPVHNIFLLVFSETGIFGLVAFFSLFLNLTFNLQLLTILFTGLSDHYWLTLQQNMLLFTYVLAITRRYAKKQFNNIL